MTLPLFIFPFWNKVLILNKSYLLGLGLLCFILIISMAELSNHISRERFSGIFEII